jgi:hypothetical protein
MVPFGDGFVIFGGIQDITHEKDDVYYYEVSLRQWILLENDSTFSKSLSPMKRTGQSFGDDKSDSRRASGRNFTVKPSYPASKSPFGRSNRRTITEKKDSLSPLKVNGYSPSGKNSPSGGSANGQSFFDASSPTKNAVAEAKEEKKKRIFQMKKNMLLQQFEVTDPNIRQALTQKSPTTESMKNSIIAINYNRNGNQSPEKEKEKAESESPGRRKKKTVGFQFLADVSKFQVPVDGKLVGHKPCARDGHSAFIIRDKMLVFGGDRHKMSFNDVYILSVDPLLKNAKL